MTQEPAAEELAPPIVDVQWSGGQQFTARRRQGPAIHIDGDAQSAPSPFDLLLGSLAACAAVDVVTILKKQRTPPQALSVRIEGSRVEVPPRRLKSAVLHFTIEARGTTPAHAERAIELSVTRYCSVRFSLAHDIPVTWTLDLKV
jgi:putative redox protein